MTHARSGFLASGHLPTLIASFLYFDVSFMAWVLLGPLAPFLREDLGLTATGQGLVTAIPLLGGSLFRPLLGALADRIGGRRTAVSTIAWPYVNSYGPYDRLCSTQRTRSVRLSPAAMIVLVLAVSFRDRIHDLGPSDCRPRRSPRPGHHCGTGCAAATVLDGSV